MPSLRKDAASDRELLITSWSANFASGLTYLSIDHRRKSVPAPDPIQKMETLKPEEKRKLSGAQKNSPLDRFKPYQRQNSHTPDQKTLPAKRNCDGHPALCAVILLDGIFVHGNR